MSTVEPMRTNKEFVGTLEMVKTAFTESIRTINQDPRKSMLKYNKYPEMTNLQEHRPLEKGSFNIYTFTLGIISTLGFTNINIGKVPISIKITFGEDSSITITEGFKYLNNDPEIMTRITIIILNMIKNLKLETFSLDGLTGVDEQKLSPFLIEAFKLLDDGELNIEDGAIHSKNFELDEIDGYIQLIIDHLDEYIQGLHIPKRQRRSGGKKTKKLIKNKIQKRKRTKKQKNKKNKKTKKQKNKQIKTNKRKH